MFDQDLCLNLRYDLMTSYFDKLNSTLGLVVPLALAMFSQQANFLHRTWIQQKLVFIFVSEYSWTQKHVRINNSKINEHEKKSLQDLQLVDSSLAPQLVPERLVVPVYVISICGAGIIVIFAVKTLLFPICALFFSVCQRQLMHCSLCWASSF